MQGTFFTDNVIKTHCNKVRNVSVEAVHTTANVLSQRNDQCQSQESSTGALQGQLLKGREERKVGPDPLHSGNKTIELPQIYTCVIESIIWPSINLPNTESLGISDWHMCNTQAALMEEGHRT